MIETWRKQRLILDPTVTGQPVQWRGQFRGISTIHILTGNRLFPPCAPRDTTAWDVFHNVILVDIDLGIFINEASAPAFSPTKDV